MNNNSSVIYILKRVAIIILIITLVFGIISTSFSGYVLASTPAQKTSETVLLETSNTNTTSSENEFKTPLEEYGELNNEAELNDDVEVLSAEDSNKFNKSIKTLAISDEQFDRNTTITLKGENTHEKYDLSSGDVFYLQGDETTPFQGDRIMKVESIYSYDKETHIEVSEPSFEDAFDSFQYSAINELSEENFVGAYYADGVTSHFGDAESEIQNVAQTTDTDEVTVQNLAESANTNAQPENLANDLSGKHGDLIVNLDHKFGKDEEDKDEEDEDDDNVIDVDASLHLTGEFGIRDLQSHIVCDMPSFGKINDFYLGASGETFVKINLEGKVEAEAEMKASKKDLAFFSLEGLSEKRFPIAVFQFVGTTPVKIPNEVFDISKQQIHPQLYVILYADWEGNIAISIKSGFSFTNGFDKGLQVFKDGKLEKTFKEYPYTKANEFKKDNVKWETSLDLEANTELTAFGSSLVFYVAGINVGELSVARIGAEAACNIGVYASSTKTNPKINFGSKDESYLRVFLKLIEINLKFKAEGKSIFDGIDAGADFHFTLFDITLFELGDAPDTWKKTPISTMQAPTKFESVITLVCDESGSMGEELDSGETKLDAAKKSANLIVTATEGWSKNYKDNYGIGLVKFSDDATSVSTPHIDYEFLTKCVDTITGGGGTCIYKGIDEAVDQLSSVESSNKIIILMTDGQDTNDTATLDSANIAAKKGIKIYTIGFGSDVNEEILTNVADATGGEYQFADTNNIVSIMGSFMYAQQASNNAEVITEFEDSVSEGETSKPSRFTVKDESGDLLISNVWPGSFLDTILIDPNGRVVDEKYPNSVTDESKIPSTITVKNPIKGEWTVKIKGIETSYEKEPFYTIVSFKEDEEPKINVAMTTKEKIAAYCLPIGIFSILASSMFLFCFLKRKSKNEETEL